jgi:hypothetical protein
MVKTGYEQESACLNLFIYLPNGTKSSNGIAWVITLDWLSTTTAIPLFGLSLPASLSTFQFSLYNFNSFR